MDFDKLMKGLYDVVAFTITGLDNGIINPGQSSPAQSIFCFS